MAVERQADPQRVVGGYELHVYCDSALPEYADNHTWFASYAGRNRRETLADAKRAGWKLRSDGTATCKGCLSNGRT